VDLFFSKSVRLSNDETTEFQKHLMSRAQSVYRLSHLCFGQKLFFLVSTIIDVVCHLLE